MSLSVVFVLCDGERGSSSGEALEVSRRFRPSHGVQGPVVRQQDPLVGGQSGVDGCSGIAPAHQIIDADAKQVAEFDQCGIAGEVLSALIGADGFLADLQFDAQPDLGHFPPLPQLTDTIAHVDHLIKILQVILVIFRGYYYN